MLSDKDIFQAYKEEKIFISPYDPDRLQPASYDVLLSNDFYIFDLHKIDIIDPRLPIKDFMTKVHIEDDGFFVLHPLQFSLGGTFDQIGVDASHSAEISGKSSLARLGLIIHTTAGFVDPGNDLSVTLELFNCNAIPIKLYPGMKIGQIKFSRLTSPCDRPYGSEGLNSKYYRAESVQPSMMHMNFAVT